MQKFLKQLSPLMKLTPARSLQTATPFINLGPMRYYKQVKDLNQVVLLAEEEEEQRKAKFLEYTQKVYKPSKTIVFDRNGELLLYSCDNFAKSQIYLKYPYVMYDAMIPLATYIFFCDPFFLAWQTKHLIFHASWMFAGLPHYLYVKSLSKKIHKIYLMRGGKYVRMVLMNMMGDQMRSWNTIREFHLLSEDFRRFADSDNFQFMTPEGQLNFEVGLQVDYFQYYSYVHNNEVIYFMKEGTVHEPEIFEQVLRGYNIDTTDFAINTEDNVRLFEPTKNY